jgi:glycosyltransferase involved in cell wall biosynthesis
MVKDEEKVVGRLLDSVRPHINSYVVQDTGSDDATREVIREGLEGIPGRIYSRPFTDFGSNRTHLLRAARKTKARYLLVLDADMELVAEGAPDLTADAYYLNVAESNITYGLPLLLRASKPWRYEGRTHEYLACDEPFFSDTLHAWSVIHHHDGSGRGDKLTRDRALLEADLNARSLFYLAQTYAEQGYLQAAADLYGARAALGGWDEEAFYARYRQGALLRDVGLLWQAWSMRPTRAEPLRELAWLYRERGANADLAGVVAIGRALMVPDDLLFVRTDCYGEKAWGEFGV